MGSFISILDKVGNVFKDIFKVALPIATAAEPFIAIAFPGSGVLYNMTVSLVTAAEAAAAAVGAPSGTGPQKLALVLAALQPYAAQEAAGLGISTPTVAQTTAYINAIVASLNAFGALATTPATSAASTVTMVGASQVTVIEEMSQETITITNYAPDRFARLETTLQDRTKLKFVGYSGEAKQFGADVKFNYDPTAQTLTVNVLHGPHMHSFDAFCAELEKFIEDQK